MADTFAIGAIPRFDAWEGQGLRFTVTSGVPGATFTVSATPPVAGDLRLDGATGMFEYVPSGVDRRPFDVTITATAGGESEAQTFGVSPYPVLPPEFRVIEHRSDARPDRESDLYVTWTERTDPQLRVFNNTTDYADGAEPRVATRAVTVSAVRLVLEAGSARHQTFARLDDRRDIRALTLCADEVVVRSPLRLPGTAVDITARVLRFEGDGSICTTPRSVAIPADTRDTALSGQAGGDVSLTLGRLEASDLPATGTGATVRTRLDTSGAPGQPGRHGLPGANGSKLATWDLTADTPAGFGATNRVDWSAFRDRLDGYEPVHVETRGRKSTAKLIATASPVPAGGEWSATSYLFEKTWPTDGAEPAKRPGRPGHGGDAGRIRIRSDDDAVSSVFRSDGFCRQDAGAAGATAPTVEGAAAGTPVKACWVRAEWNWNLVDRNDALDLVVLARNVSKPRGPEVGPGPDPALPAGQPGTWSASLVSGGADSIDGVVVRPAAPWVHPAAVRAVNAYARDAILAGCHDDAGAVLEPYRYEFAGVQESLELTTVAGEVSRLGRVVDGPHDYFGHPAGWVPMLSFEANLRLYRNEVAAAIPTLFLAYWIEQKSGSDRSAAMSLVAAVERMEEQTATATRDYLGALAVLERLEAERGNLVADIESFGTQLKEIENQQRAAVRDDSRLEYALRGGASVLGGLMQLIPVGEPVVGAVGKALSVASTIDRERPWDSAGELVKAFAPVGRELLVPKVKQYAKSVLADPDEPAAPGHPRRRLPKTETEVEAFRRKFDAEVEKKAIEARVKTHLEEMTRATDQVTGVLGAFSAPQSVIEERLAKALADCPAYRVLANAVEELNRRKKKLAEELHRVTATLRTAATTIVGNQTASSTLCGELNSRLSQLSHDAAQYASAMGQRARERLVAYQYYLLKSYQYHMLADHPGVDFRVTRLFDGFAGMLARSADGSLTSDEYDNLRGTFDDQLRELVAPLVAHYQAHPLDTVRTYVVTLTPAQLARLNEPAGRLTVDLMAMGVLSLRQDDIRITEVGVDRAELLAPPDDAALSVDLTFRHSGESRRRRDGRLYLFRTGTAGESGYADTHMQWGVTVTHGANAGTEWRTSKPEPAQDSLLRTLLGDASGPAARTVLHHHPAAWAALTIERDVLGQPTRRAGQLARLDLRISVSATGTAPEQSTVAVGVADGIRPRVRVEARDLNGLTDGRGSFLRTYDSRRTPRVALTAPADLGRREFLGWRILETQGVQAMGEARPARLGPADRAAGPAAPSDERRWVPTRTIELDLRARPAYHVEPVYGPAAADALS